VSRAAGEAAEAKLAVQLPEPGRFWIRYVPRSWETLERPWLNLAAGGLGDWRRKARSVDLAPLADAPLDDVLYLAAVPPYGAAARDELARVRLVGGTPVLLQLSPGEETTVPPAGGAAIVFDLLAVLLERDLGALRRLPSGAAAVWPLLPGLTDEPALWEQGCRALAAAGVRCAQALTPALQPADRRRLAEGWGGERTFDALFHGRPPAERDFARIAHRHGLEPFLSRPLPPGHGARNRWIGGVLALAGELWLRLGRPVEQGQAFYRAARWIDRASYDLEALAREGNLGVLPFDPASRAIVAECAAGGESGQLARLVEEYVAPGEAGADESRRTADAETLQT
jgi:hypothetical protein